MKKFLPVISPYLMLIFPVVFFIGLTLVVNNTDFQNALALENALSKSEKITQSPKTTSNFVTLLIKK
jgi:hypothetical protein